LRRKSSEYARAIVGLQENFQSTTILSHSTLIPAYIIIPIVTRNGLMRQNGETLNQRMLQRESSE
ncbi:MAG TPA: hypothetical protein VFK06_13075, partial [Candidatus Angelobacter sp.]|nr:hypothetical protein [Candidatus Angelobacter sp.]